MARRDRSVVLGVLMLAFFSTMVARLVISPVVPRLIADFQTSKTWIGAVLTGMWAAYAVLQFPAGALAERIGARRVVMVGLSGTAAGSLVLAVAPSFAGFGVGAIVIGIGAGLYFPAGVALIDARYSNTGQAIGLHLSGGDLAGVVAPVVAVAVAVRVGWRPAVALGAVVAIPAIALSAWGLDRRVDRPPDRPDSVRDTLRVLFAGLARPRVAYTVGLATVLAFTFQSVVSFYPTFLVEYWALPASRAGAVFAGVFLIWIVFLPITGRIADSTDRDLVLGVVVSLLAIGMATVVGAPSLRVVYLGTAMLGVGMSWGGVIAARILEAYPTADRTAGFGAARASYVFLAAGGNVVTGWLADTAGWSTAYGVIAGLLAVVVLVVLLNRLLDLGY